MKCKVLLFSLISCLLRSVSSKEDKYVKIGLDANWSQTPVAMEVSEYLAPKSINNYWSFVAAFSSTTNLLSDKDKYDESISKASQLLSNIEIDLLKFSLSLRSYSPKVRLFQQIGEMLDPTCDVFFQIEDGKYLCSLEEVMGNLGVGSARSPSIHLFDHVYPGSENNKHLLLVYGDLTSKRFQEVHQQLIDQLEARSLKYVHRHYAKNNNNATKVMLSGYGVELAVKSTEYKAVDDQKVEGKKKSEKLSDNAEGDDEVEGFLFKRLRELHPTLKDNLDQLKDHLKESNKELAPLKVWQLQDLSYQASQRIISASSQDVLKVLKDLSQSVPMVARSLVKTTVDENLKREVKENQKEFEKLGVSPGGSALYINGIEMGDILEEVNAYKLFNILNEESVPMAALGKLQLENDKIGKVLALNVKPQLEKVILDTRSESVQWLNDLEKDPQYRYWPSSLNEILRPTFPGMMRYIAKNIYHVVLYVDPVSQDFSKLFEILNDQIENSVPARFGIVFVTDDNDNDLSQNNVGAALMRAYSFIKSDHGRNIEALMFLKKVYRKSSNKIPTAKDVLNVFLSMYGKSEAEEHLGSDSEYDDLRRTSNQKFKSLGMKSLPKVFVNGEEIDTKNLLDNFDQSMVDLIMSQTPGVQEAVYMGKHYSYPNIYDYLMSKPNVVSRINPLIQNLNGKSIKFEDFENIDGKEYSPSEAAGALLKSAKYFISDEGATTVFVIANANTKDGRNLLKNAMKYVPKRKDVRLSIVLHGNSNEPTVLDYNSAVQIILNLRQKLITGVAKLLAKFLESDMLLEEMVRSEDNINEIAAGITGINKKKLLDLLTSDTVIQNAHNQIMESSHIVERAFDIINQDNLVVANGRIFGPLNSDEVFMVDDFELLQNFENGRCGYKIKALVNKMNLPNVPADGHERYKSDIVLKLGNILSTRGDKSRSEFTYSDDKYSVIHLAPRDPSAPRFDIEAILDPLSKDAQKLSAILQVLYDSFNIDLHLFLNPKDKHSEMPVNRFYQFVLQPTLNFDDNGNLLHDQAATFKNLPHSALLTLNMDTPSSWMIKAVGNNHDLDNIHLGEAGGIVYGDFELEHIIVEGKCTDSKSFQHPRGLQFVLGTEVEPDMFDTIVMANLGYFQLKASPGLFVLQLRDGRSSQVYQIESLEGGSELSPGQNFTVFIDDFIGKLLSVQVIRRPGQEKADLLEEKDEESSDDDLFGLWESITSYVKTKEKSTKNTDGKIHIFSVATGLLYERFLRIMMLSVLKHTKTPVKFWFLKNYLSAGFTNFLPTYAEKYGFEYELVQYQWPQWLNGQTEKQRIIWGYKILFLDVLFPLNLERIIFVDADQIVRADLKELMDMDLDGAPYAYTPFCNDRKEVEGFRFWNQGYWRNHLAGRPYHISALYVVDLKRFRRVAAGDRLRGQYQGLSQDPNSLANLDQDLPNNMIHQVQIKSLPQEWLWCETWCSDESKKKAKTIDMCNNPQTKEPKLQRAMRIAPEWSEYDEIIKKLMDNDTSAETILKSTQSTVDPRKIDL